MRETWSQSSLSNKILIFQIVAEFEFQSTWDMYGYEFHLTITGLPTNWYVGNFSNTKTGGEEIIDLMY